MSLSGRGQQLDMKDLLERLPALRSLDLFDFSIDDLTWLQSGTKLEQLNLDVASGAGRGLDLSPVADLPQIKRIRCRHVHSIGPLNGKRLGYLEVGRVDDSRGATEDQQQAIDQGISILETDGAR